MEVKAMGRSNTVAYKKIEKAMGNHGEPRNPLTTFQEETIIAILMISHRIRPPIPFSTTKVPTFLNALLGFVHNTNYSKTHYARLMSYAHHTMTRCSSHQRWFASSCSF